MFYIECIVPLPMDNVRNSKAKNILPYLSLLNHRAFYCIGVTLVATRQARHLMSIERMCIHSFIEVTLTTRMTGNFY